MPSLVGLDAQYLVSAMKAYTNGQRKHDLMKALLAGVSETELNSIALYYARQAPARAQTAGGRRCNGRKGRQCRLCRLSRRAGGERESGLAEPRRAGCALSRQRHQGLQGRLARRRNHEGARRGSGRAHNQRYRHLLRQPAARAAGD